MDAIPGPTERRQERVLDGTVKLDRAADALDALRTDHRLVGIITHLRELADRLPVHIVVHKSETGSTVEVA